LLPDAITLPLLWLGLLASLVTVFVDPVQALLGAAFGYLSLWSVYWVFKLVTGKEGMGAGDFKLLAALGAWCGVTSLLGILLVSSAVGAVIGGAWLLLRGKDRSTQIPFGPYLAIAGWLQFYFQFDLLAYVLRVNPPA
jgi:leader peptidase (prepilin peptidase)/N-methyltransferase